MRGLILGLALLANSAGSNAITSLRLLRMDGLGTDWETRRVVLKNIQTGVVGEYKIGDVLPGGVVLVGIQLESTDLMLENGQLIRLYFQAPAQIIQDLSALRIEPKATPKAALARLRIPDPRIVQKAIDELIGRGDPIVDALISEVEVELPISAGVYNFPSGSERRFRPRTVNEIVIIILETITGQKLGNSTRATLTAEQRRDIAHTWKRWWTGT